MSSASGPRQEISPPKVVLRIKPINTLAVTADINSEYYEVEDNTLRVRYLNQKDLCTSSYKFTKILNPTAAQEDVYKEAIENCVRSFVFENHQLIFAYGTSNSGKSYTIQGTGTNPGIIPRILLSLFESIKNVRNLEPRLCPRHYDSCVEITQQALKEVISIKNDILKFQNATLPKNLNPADDTIRNFSNDTIFKNIGLIKKYDVAKVRKDCAYSIWISCLEIYNENIYDLFSKPETKNTSLKIKRDRESNPYVENLLWLPVDSHVEAYDLYRFAKSRLHISCTELNQKSSRSHFIFEIRMVSVENKDPTSYYGPASLAICDLAGTERITKSKERDPGINMSLLALNKCLTALRQRTKGQNVNVPYRESKITRLFQNGFTCDTSITMIANMNQSSQILHETISILGYTAVASEIKIRAKKEKAIVQPAQHENYLILSQELTNLKEQMESLKAENVRIKTENVELTTGKIELKYMAEKVKLVEKERDQFKRQYFETQEKFTKAMAILNPVIDYFNLDYSTVDLITPVEKGFKLLDDQIETLRGSEFQLKTENETLKAQVEELVKQNSVITKTDDDVPQVVIHKPKRSNRKSLSLTDLSENIDTQKIWLKPSSAVPRTRRTRNITSKVKSETNLCKNDSTSDSDEDRASKSTRTAKKRKPLRRLLTYSSAFEDDYKPQEESVLEIYPSPSNLLKTLKPKRKK